MQFLAVTWASYGVDGNGDGVADRWVPADAIFAAAHYLAASGAPGDYRKAIFAYNHADWYVVEVDAWAARYRGSTLSQPASVELLAADEAAETGADTRLAAQPRSLCASSPVNGRCCRRTTVTWRSSRRKRRALSRR